MTKLALSAISRGATVFLAVTVVVACDDDDRPSVDAGTPALVEDAGADAAPDAGAVAANRPASRPVTGARIAQLVVPPGFRVGAFARGLTNPRMLAVGPGGDIFVTSRAAGAVYRLRDLDGDGDADDAGEQVVVASRAESPALEGVHGIAIQGNRIWLAATKSVLTATLVDGMLQGLQTVLDDLPDGGQHPNRTLALGPDGKLYVSVGSSCNACPETNPEHATMLRIEPTGGLTANPPNVAHPLLARDPQAVPSPRVFASGLRNTIGFDWHPTTNELWGWDHGSDGLGDDVPPEELNRIVAGRSHGWPYCWSNQRIDPIIEMPRPEISKEAYCATTQPPVAEYQAHSAPIGFLFYRGTQFPAEYRGDGFVAMRGSWNRSTPVGYKVVRVHFENGVPAPLPGRTSRYEDFLTGFLLEDGAAQFGRLAGLAVDATGALLVAEDENGVVYRVSYEAGQPADAGVRD